MRERLSKAYERASSMPCTPRGRLPRRLPYINIGACASATYRSLKMQNASIQDLVGIDEVPLQAPAPAAASKRKRQLLSRGFREGLVKLCRDHGCEFVGKPLRKDAAVRYLRALLPNQPAGRPSEERITKAAQLLRTYQSQYPNESHSERWRRIYGQIPNLKTSKEKRNLRAAVRSRTYARRRRRDKAKQ
jgi:hypothetical protein